jgi:hypothetical protein
MNTTVQDLIRGLLRIFLNDIRPEEWTPSHAGKSARMDFLMPEVETVLETKMTRKGPGEKHPATRPAVHKGAPSSLHGSFCKCS